MAHCLFCGKEFKYEDVLFFKRIDMGGEDDNGNSQNTWQAEEEETNEADKNPEQSAADTPEGEPAKESGSGAGRWVSDEVYHEFLTNYLYMNEETVYKKQRIFYVNWSSRAGSKGCGKGTLGEGDKVPQWVKLCDDDVQALNNGLPKGIPIATLSECCCPNCHMAFPQGYLNTPEDHICRIGLIGGPRAGKTEYITTAYQNISSVFGAYNMGTFEASGMSKKILDYLSGYYEKHLAPPETKFSVILPLVLSYSRVDENGQFKGYVVLYDIPGELFMDGHEDELLMFEGTLFLSDAVMIIMDCGGQVFTELQEVSQLENDNQSCLAPIKSIVERYWGKAGPGRKDSTGKEEKPLDAVAIVLSKFDKALSHPTLLSNHAKCPTCFEPMDRKVHHDGKVNMNAINTLNNEMTLIVDDETISLAIGISGQIKKILKVEPKMFPVSTRHKTSDGYVESKKANAQRHRLLEPLLYLMAKKHMIPASGDIDWMAGLTPREHRKYDKLEAEINDIKGKLEESEEMKERKRIKLDDRLEKLETEMKSLQEQVEQRMREEKRER